MKNYLRLFTLTTFVFLLSIHLTKAQTLYKVTLYRAAPGQLLPLIEDLQQRVSTYTDNSGDKPYIVRHSQGDQWDLMIYEHIDNLKTYYTDNDQLNEIFTPNHGVDFYKLVSFHETIYAEGSNYSTVAQLFERSNFFHVEMFVALAGKQNELLKQRQMENVYLQEIGRGENLIFTVNQGGHWDSFTLGGYRDIKHYAESADIPEEVEEKAAIKAGFKGANDISPYLRSLIDMHHDTLGGKVK
jgi:hypothetical protein